MDNGFSFFRIFTTLKKTEYEKNIDFHLIPFRPHPLW